MAEEVAALADRADHFVAGGGQLARGDGDDLVPGVVEGRAGQVVHGRVDDREVLLDAGLEVFDAREQQAGVAHQRAARLEAQGLGAALEAGEERLEVVGGGGRLFVAVTDAEAAAQVDVVEVDAFAGELVDQAEDLAGGFGHRGRVEELGADVAVDARDLDGGHPGGLAVEVEGLGEGHAELVAAQAGGDVGVGVGVDVGVHAEGDRRALAELGGHVVQAVELGGGFDVEAADAGLEGEAHLVDALADAREDHLARVAAGRQHAGQLAAGDDVEAGAELGEHRQDAQAGVGLDRVADQRLAHPEGLLVGLVGAGEGGAGIHVGGGAEALGDVGEGDPFEGQSGGAGGKGRHGQGGRHWAESWGAGLL